MAAMDGRFSVAIDDIKKVAIPVLRHRISTNFQAQAEGKTSEDVIETVAQGGRRAGDREVREEEEVNRAGSSLHNEHNKQTADAQSVCAVRQYHQ